MKKYLLLMALLLSFGLSAYAQETLAYECLFGSAYNSKKVSSYTDTWSATNKDFTWTIVNFNNNSNQWKNYVKCGSNKNASVGKIITASAMEKPIYRVEIVIDAITATSVNSITLKTSTTNSFTNPVETHTFTKAAGTQSVTLNNPSDNLYYEISFDCKKASSNGPVQLSSVKYYTVSGPVKPSTPTFSIDGKAVTGTYEAPYNSEVSVLVSSKDATSLVFSSPTTLGTKNGNSYTVTGIKTPTTITVKGVNDEGESEESTLNVTFQSASLALTAPSFTYNGSAATGTLEVKAGDVITAATPTQGATVTLTAVPADAAVINGTSATINANCTLTATAKLGDATKTTTLNVTVKEVKPAPAGAFKLLTNVNDLKDGMEVILAYGTKAVAAFSNNKFNPATITLNDTKDVITDNGGAYIFTLTKVTNGWTIYSEDGKGYITAGTSGTNISYASATAPSNANTFTFTAKSNNEYSIIAKSTTSRALVYNGSVFGNYATSNVTSGSDYHYLNIYYRDSAVEAPEFMVAADATFETGSDGKYYTNPFKVTLSSATEGASIEYSIDGGETWQAYAAPLDVAKTTTIKAYAKKEGLAPSDEVEAVYTLRTGRPAIVCNDPEEAESKTVTITSATKDAVIEYSLDNGTTWLPYTAPLTVNEMGKTVNIMARASSALDAEGKYSDVAENQVSIYPALKWQPFELLTDITKLVPGDEVIFVAPGYNKGLAPYVTGDNNCKAADVLPADGIVKLDPASEAIGIYKVEKTDDGKFRFKGTFHGGYLAAVAGETNRLVCLADADLTAKHASEATVLVDPTTGEASITFEGEGVTRGLLRYSNAGGNYLFSCYADANGATYPVSIYRRGEAAQFAPRPVALPQEGVYDEGEISEITLQCLDAAGNVVTDPSLSIWYTLDGSDPRLGGKLYTAPIPVSDNMTVRAYATMDGCFDSPSLIASYDIFSAGKQYRRVTPAELRQLKANDDIIILGSPSDEEAVYALSRRQHGEDNDAYREAVRLDNVVKSDGRITINKKEVQVVTVIPAVDYYTNGGYDWRLYVSGSSVGGDYNMDGYLLAQDNNNALETQRIDTPASEILPNADVRFRSLAVDGQGNEYGGVTVQFGSATGHEETYPKLMALTRTADGYRFDVRKDADFKGSASSSWYVSIFKLFDENYLYAPSFTNMDLRITEETEIEITSPNSDTHPDTEIWYSLDGGNTWTLYTGAFTIAGEGEHHIMARTRNAALNGTDADGYSEITEQTYIITDNEVFELVTDTSSLKENDRIIFVNAIEFTAGVRNTDGTPIADRTQLDNKYGADADWYSFAKLDGGKFITEGIDAIDDNDVPQMITVPSESNIQVFRLEYDTSAANPERPWLLNAGDIDGKGADSYLRSSGEKNFGFTSLPDDIEQRQYMNCGIEISTLSDYGYYRTSNYTSYNSPGAKEDIESNAFVTFNGPNGTTNYLRFNPSGTDPHFQAYKENSDSKNQPTQNTWPVRIYRATKRVLPPTVTVYDAQDEDKAYETEIETFNNAVRVVIRHNPKTDEGTDLRYSWSKSMANAPVLSEYLAADPVDAEEIQLLVDGDKIEMLMDGEFKAIDELPDIEGKHVLRAVAVDEMNASESLPRLINFQCAKPILGKAEESDAVSVTRPAIFTQDAVLYYAYDNDAMVIDDAHMVNYVAGTTDYETIPFEGHEKVRVVAVKKGYKQSEEAVYTPYTFTPRAHAIQLLELTAEGKANFAGLLDEADANFIKADEPCYVTYRTVPNGQFYLLREDNLGVEGEFELAACNDNAAARELIDYRPQNSSQDKVNVKFTTDYYVHVLDEDDFHKTVGDDAVPTAKIFVNSSTSGRPAQAATFKLNGEDKTYHGVLLKRHGAIGTLVLKSEVTYNIVNNGSTETYVENGYDEITPVIPSVYGGHYAYVYSQEEQDLNAIYPTDFLKFKVESRVKKNADGSWAESEVLIPTAELNPRHFDAVITFFRPNVSDEILRRNDIYYTVDVRGTKAEVRGSGLYVDRAQADLELGTTEVVPEFYRFTVTNVSPRADLYPMIKVTATEYVENYMQSTNYSRFASNYGDDLEVVARNIPKAANASIEKVHLGRLAPGQTDGFGNRNNGTHNSWMYKGHYQLNYSGDIAHENEDNTEEAVALEPLYYHVETYVPGTEHYASYEYLVKHVPGHASSADPLGFGPNGEFITDDEDDPLLGTYIATEVPEEGVTVALTPVYIFSRDPEANPDGENETLIAQLDLVQAAAPAAETTAAAAAPAKVVAKAANLGSDATAPVLGEVRPMRHYGSTDMTADNITDLTANAPFDVVPGTEMVRTLESGEVTGVENVAIDAIDADAEYYNLQGIRILNPTHGVYIKRRGAVSEKVIL